MVIHRKKRRPTNSRSRVKITNISAVASPAPPPVPRASSNGLWLILAGLTLSAWSLLVVPQFQYVVPQGFPLPGTVSLFLFISGVLLIFFGVRSIPAPLPHETHADPLSSGWARSILFIILAFGLYVRLRDLNQPFGHYWDDPALDLADSCSMLDLKLYHMVFPVHSQNPLFDYWLLSLWSFVPQVKGFIMQRWGSALMDVISIWLCYLLGKEISNRRTGLLLAFLVAISKPLIREVYRGMLVLTCPLSAAMSLLFLFRLLKKPTMAHALQWGFSLAVILYSYSASRPWIPYMVLFVLLWFIFDRSKKLASGALTFGLIWWVVWMTLFVQKNGFFSSIGPVGNLLKLPFFLPVLVVLMGLWFKQQWIFSKTESADRRILYWASGTLLALVLMWPLLSHPVFSQRTLSLSIFQLAKDNPAIGDPFMFILKNCWITIQAFFLGQGEFSDAIFDFHDTLLILLGFVVLFARPSMTGFILALTSLASISAYTISWQPHHARAIPSVVPLLAVAAWGLDRIASSLKGSWRSKGWMLLIFAFLIWSIPSSLWKVDHWAHQEGPGTIVANLIRQAPAGTRPYMGSASGYTTALTQGIMCEGRPFWVLNENNLIVIKADEPTPNLEVILSGGEKALIKKFLAQFPSSKIVEKRASQQASADVPMVVCIMIPASEIPSGPGKMFQLKRMGPTDRLRQIFFGLYGLGRGAVSYEDAVSNIDDPLPLNGPSVIRISGLLNAPSLGKYKLTSKNLNFVVLWIDGKKIMDLRPRTGLKEAIKTIELTQGEHQIELRTFTLQEARLPKLLIEGPGMPESSLFPVR